MKKGFTLIELMVTITLLGIIITIASISIVTFKKNSDERLKEQKIKYIETGAIKWGEDHLNLLSEDTCTCILVNNLITDPKKYITGDDSNNTILKIPGTNKTFNDKSVCVKYENVYANVDLNNGIYTDASGSSRSYIDSYLNATKYEVTAKYDEGECY